MPIYEYKCEACGKRLEVLQTSMEPYTHCGQISECTNHGEIRKQVSVFSFKGDSSSADNFMNQLNSPSEQSSGGGCGCHGTSACPGASSIRSKYGLD